MIKISVIITLILIWNCQQSYVWKLDKLCFICDVTSTYWIKLVSWVQYSMSHNPKGNNNFQRQVSTII